jgi:hypothetical protein
MANHLKNSPTNELKYVTPEIRIRGKRKICNINIFVYSINNFARNGTQKSRYMYLWDIVK